MTCTTYPSRDVILLWYVLFSYLGFMIPSWPYDEKMGTHCVHVGSTVHAPRTSLTHSYMPDAIVQHHTYMCTTHKNVPRFVNEHLKFDFPALALN